MEAVGRGAVIHDNHFVKVPAEPAEVLHVVALIENTRLSEQAPSEHAPLVQQICHRVSVLRAQRGALQ